MGGRKVPGLGGRGEGCKRWRLHKRFYSIFHGSLVIKSCTGTFGSHGWLGILQGR